MFATYAEKITGIVFYIPVNFINKRGSDSFEFFHTPV